MSLFFFTISQESRKTLISIFTTVLSSFWHTPSLKQGVSGSVLHFWFPPAGKVAACFLPASVALAERIWGDVWCVAVPLCLRSRSRLRPGLDDIYGFVLTAIHMWLLQMVHKMICLVLLHSWHNKRSVLLGLVWTRISICLVLSKSAQWAPL